MTSPPLERTHGRMTSGVACHHRLSVAHTVERRRAWHAIIALGWQTRSNDVGCGMPSSPSGSTHGRTTSSVAKKSLPLVSTHGRTTSGVACHHRLWAAHTVERRRLWHALGQQTRSDDVRRDMHHCLWTAHTVGRRRAWHAIIAFGQHTRLNDVGRGMLSSPLENKHDRQRRAWHDISALGQHAWSDEIGHGMSSSPLGSTHDRTTSGVALHHHPWTAHTVERHRP